MKHYFKKILALVAVISLCMGNIVFAQALPTEQALSGDASGVEALVVQSPSATAASDAPAPVSVDAPSTVLNPPAEVVLDQAPALSSSDQTILIQGSTSVVQDATTTQTSVPGDMLESTTNPETATTTEAVYVPLVDTGTTTPVMQVFGVEQATSTGLVATNIDSPPALNVVADHVDQTVALVDLPIVAAPAEVVSATPVPAPQDVAPQPEFSFALTGKHIPTKRKIDDAHSALQEETVSQALVPQVDNEKGVVTVTGQCTDKYFVVLLFKNATDYIDDPRSYIVNRAYPCVGGEFSYAISELPNTLPGGEYYLLVGQEGDRGTWRPITSLTEITINKNQ